MTTLNLLDNETIIDTMYNEDTILVVLRHKEECYLESTIIYDRRLTNEQILNEVTSKGYVGFEIIQIVK